MTDNPALACVHPSPGGLAHSPEALCAGVAQLLNYAPQDLEPDASLIEQGLDSVSMMRLPALLAREGVQVSFAELIEQPTLEAWWALIDGRRGPPAHLKPVATDSDFPLTPLQQAYWFGRDPAMPLGGVGCHLYQELDGPQVDAQRLEHAVVRLTQRHPMLRACFPTATCQRILPVSPWPGLTVHELPDALALRERLAHRCLEVRRGEVFDVQLSHLPNGRSRVHLNIDLLVADVLSISVLLRDLALIYSGQEAQLPRLEWDFAHYLSATRTTDAGARDYWLQRLDDLPDGPQLPLAQEPQSLGAPRFRRLAMRLGRAQLHALEDQARQHGLTLASVLCCAYAQVLARWSASQHFLLNVPLFNRQELHPCVPHLLADFSNLVLLEVDQRQAGSFAQQAQTLQRQLHRDIAHSAWPGVEVLRELSRTRQGGAPVVFACNLGEAFVDATCREHLGEPGWALSQTPQVWLDHQSYPLPDGLLLNWDAVDALFPEGLLDEMFAAYGDLLAWLCTGDWRQPAPLPLPHAQQQVRTAVNHTPWAYDEGLLHAGFFQQARLHPQRVALITEEGELSYAELATEALHVAGALGQWGIETGDAVAITLPKGQAQIIAVLGVLAAGAVYVPVGIEQPAARRDMIYQRAGAKVVITDAAHRDRGVWLADLQVVDLAQARSATALKQPGEVSPEALAYVIFTSGTTGEPKGVEVSHQAALNTVETINRRYQVCAQDRVLGVSALDFDLSVYDLFGLLSVGGAVVLPADACRKEPSEWLRLVRQQRVTLWNSVPALLDMLTLKAREPNALAGLRLAMVSGDWVGLDLPRRLRVAAGESTRFAALGGATEAAIWSNVQDVDDVPAHWRSIPYGKPLDNQCFRVVDSQGRDCPDWVAGELWIGGAGVAQGYRGLAHLSAQRFVEQAGQRWYRTGDQGRYWPDGTLEFLGRMDHQVKVRGFRIELSEIDIALERHPAVSRAVTLVLPGANPQLAAALTGDAVPDADAMHQWLCQWLPEHMLPDHWLNLSELPLSANGKVDRAALLWLVQEQRQGAKPESEDAPQGEAEQLLAGLWRELLDIPLVGRHQGFFALGGNSLLAARLIERIARQFDVELSLKDFFNAATVARQAQWLAARREQDHVNRNAMVEGAL
ncbi:amino acid adenylation domain-containing protein [Pseudomonas sp. 1912-s]|uniref:non-ribosomal peptide synthetase n=1 Tax=Pseudomonas sp. 1912-s TaxID=3033802 RepID=UPI0023DF64F7|nr:amino acid adenylation domain-containing protein [Pseudomonas sp. 1912-s]MDF3200874.1 amino acid adenylation domain-containing protein [Pseudomonas sp. 1912-s]